MIRPRKRTKAKDRLVDAANYFFHGPYMEEADETVIALTQEYERVLHAQSENGRYFDGSREIIAAWEARKRQAEQNMDGEFFKNFGRALCRLRKYQDFVLRNRGPSETDDAGGIEIGATSSEAVIRDAAAHVGFTLARRLGRLPTEKEVRIETKHLLARLAAGKSKDATADRAKTELKLFQERDSIDRNIPWRRIFKEIASYKRS
jgi:hypothetical protein